MKLKNNFNMVDLVSDGMLIIENDESFKNSKQLETLNKKLKSYLNGNTLKTAIEDELTKDELYLITYFVKFAFRTKSSYTKKEGVFHAPISKRFCIDYIGYNEVDFMDILICRNQLII